MITSMEPPIATTRKWWKLNLTRQILLSLVLGALIGWWIGAAFGTEGLDPAAQAAVLAKKKVWLDWFTPLRENFLHLIKAIIAPLVFAHVVQGIAGTGDLKKGGP